MAIINNKGKPERNLQEQVIYLTIKAEQLEKALEEAKTLLGFDIRVIDVMTTWEEPTGTFDYGDTILVGPEGGPFTFYIYTRGVDSPYWLDFGRIAIEGPQGPQGEPGPQGEHGTNTRWYIGSSAPTGPDIKDGDCWLRNSDCAVFIYENSKWKMSANIRGLQGPVGPEGRQGPKGIPGEQGPQGPRGAPAPVVNILDMLTSEEQLPDPSSVEENAGFLITENGVNYLFIIMNGIWVNSGRWGGGTSVYSGGQFVETFNADTKMSIPSNYPNYGVIPMVAQAGTTSEFLYLDSSLGGGPSGVGNSRCVPTYKASTASINTAGLNSRVLLTGTPTKDMHCANKKYVDEKIAAAHDGGFQPHARIFAVHTETAEEPPQYTVYAGLVADTWDYQGFINFPVESLVIYTSGNYTPMAGANTLAIERVDSDYFDGLGSPVEWSIYGGNVTTISGDGFVTQSEYEGQNQTIKLTLRVLSGADEAYIQITQYPGTGDYVHY